MIKKSLGAIMVLASAVAIAQQRTVPARILPVPTDVSPQMQAIASRPIPPNFDVVPKTLEEWAALQGAYNDSVEQALPGQEQRLRDLAVSSKQRILQCTELNDSERRAILGSNALRLFPRLHSSVQSLGWDSES